MLLIMNLLSIDEDIQLTCSRNLVFDGGSFLDGNFFSPILMTQFLYSMVLPLISFLNQSWSMLTVCSPDAFIPQLLSKRNASRQDKGKYRNLVK